jgi:hypothetical protein
MLRSVALLRTDVSQERISCIIVATRVGEPGTTFAVNSNVVPISPILFILVIVAIRISETSVLKRATRYHIAEYGSLHSCRRENLKYYNFPKVIYFHVTETAS